MRLEIAAVAYRVRSRRILNGIDIVLESGVICLLGPNGAGKTTLLRILATVLAPSSGRVRLIDDGVTRPVQRNQLGYVPQTFAYYSNFTTRQFVEYVASLKQIPRHQLSSAVDRALCATDLEGYGNQRLGTLSGGTLRRAAIAQAIVNDPALLILDEPTAGLDPSQRRAFMQMIADVTAERIVLLSTHLVEDVTASAGRVLVLNEGRIIFDGTPRKLAGQEPDMELSTERIADGYEQRLIDESLRAG